MPASDMDQQAMRDILSGRRQGAGWAMLRAGLWATSKPYGAAMRLRRWAYRGGVLRSRSAGVPVICVGNLTTGGTGKTPMVAWVVGRLKEADLRPAILTRGYRGQATGGAGDEAQLLAELTGVPVEVDADRVAAARRAASGGAEVLVMDDGFQHLRLRRDLDIVLIDATSPFGYGHCLPRGLLRELPAALADADAVVITHGDQLALDALAQLNARLRGLARRASFHTADSRPAGLLDESGAARPLGDLLGRRVFAFCGLAAPDHFFGSLAGLGAAVVGRRALDDHAAYTQGLLDDLAAEAAAAGAEVLLTTRKDHVKLAGLEPRAAVWQLAVEMVPTAGRQELLEKVLASARAGRQRPPL